MTEPSTLYRFCRWEPLRGARTCYDHLAGALGAAICQNVLRAGWVRRRRAGRGLIITPLGAVQLDEMFDIRITAAP
jgi:hypothetical protein